jgi:nucleoside 2-deoxyribosyltransferase
MKIYLASPFFNDKEILIYDEVIKKLRQKHEVFVPREHVIENAWEMTNKEWGKAVFDMDVDAIRDCDVVVALNWGMYSDSGTAWECGFAYGIGKKVINLICDAEKEYSVMMINGAEEVKNLEDELFDIQTSINILQK